MRAIGGGLALVSLVSLITAFILFGGSVADRADDTRADVIDVSPTSEPVSVEPIATVPPTSTAEPTVDPVTDAVSTVRLPTSEPVTNGAADAGSSDADLSDAEQGGDWCVGERPVDVRLAPEDGAEVIGQIDAATCGLDQLAPTQEGWMAVRSGTGLDVLEGWVWGSDLVPVE